MVSTDYFESYMSFVKKTYPRFYKECYQTYLEKDKRYFKEIINAIYKLFLHISILKEVSSKNTYFLEETEKITYSILFLIPTNDSYSINSFSRALSESVLRLILLNNKNNTNLSQSDISKMSFNNIKKEIDKNNFLFSRKNKFVYLYNLFAVSSKKLHSPGISIANHTFFDEQFDEKYELKKMSSVFQQINKIFLEFIIPDVFELALEDISLSNSIKIKKLLSRKEFNLYKKYLSKNQRWIMVNIEVFQKVNKKDVSFIKETIASILGSKFIILHRIINYNLNPSILTGLKIRLNERKSYRGS